MTLGAQSDQQSISQLFHQLIEDNQLEGHNLIWSSVLWGRQLDKTAQRQCVDCLLSLNKQSMPANMSFGQLLNKLQTVFSFDASAPLANRAVIDLAASINNISESIFDPAETHHGADSASAFISLLDSQRSAILEPNSPQTQITATYLNSIKEASAAALIPLLKYLQQVGGKVSSEFGQAWLIALVPKGVSKEAIERLMTSYTAFTNLIKEKMLKDINNMSSKMAVGYQVLTDQTKKILSGKLMGGTLVASMLAYQVYSIYNLLTDNSLKTQAQQNKQDLQLWSTGAGAISTSFRLVTFAGEGSRISESVLSNVKFLGNFFGLISGLIKSGLTFTEDMKDKSKSETILFRVSAIIETLSTVDFFLQLFKTSLVEILREKLSFANLLLARALTGAMAIVTIERLIIGLVLIMINLWVNLGLFIIQLTIELNKDDEIETWLKRCRFGRAQLYFNSNYADRYVSAEQEQKELKAIFEKFQQQLADYYQEQQDIKNKTVIKPPTDSVWITGGLPQVFSGMR